MLESDEIKNLKKIHEDFEKRDLKKSLLNSIVTPAAIALIASFLLWIFLAGKKTSDVTFKDRNERDIVIQRTLKPLVTKSEFTKEIKSVRHDMAVADTTLFKLSNTKYTSLKEAIIELSSNQKDFEKKIDSKMEKQTDRIIEVIRNQKR